MESAENCVMNGKYENGDDTMEQQYEEEKPNHLNGHDDMDDMDNKVIDFEAHFDGNDLHSGNEYDENDDESLENR